MEDLYVFYTISTFCRPLVSHYDFNEIPKSTELYAMKNVTCMKVYILILHIYTKVCMSQWFFVASLYPYMSKKHAIDKITRAMRNRQVCWNVTSTMFVWFVYPKCLIHYYHTVFVCVCVFVQQLILMPEIHTSIRMDTSLAD